MRLKVLSVSFAVFFTLLASCLYYIQIIKGPAYKEMGYRNSIRLLSINAPRGIIYDRRDRKIAENILSFGVFIVPQEVVELDSTLKRLSEILDCPESLLKRNYNRHYQAPFAPCEVKRNISKKDAILIEELRLDMRGVLVKELPLRSYPYAHAFAHLAGYIAEINKSELSALKSYGYAMKDLIGKDGVERIADNALRGKSGGMQIQVDNRGRQVKVLNLKRPVKGEDVYLTVDAGLQDFIWKAMGEKRGAAIFMDPHTGEILSLVSTPSYDPNGSIASVLYDSDAPLMNRALMGQYPPGSIFKILLGLAGLESGTITPQTNFVCNGRLTVGKAAFNCWNLDGHGAMDIRHAIVESCNVFFYNVGLMLKAEKIYEYARRLGFGKKTGIELSGEEEGIVPTRAWKRMQTKERWFAGDTANLSIGQGYLLVTPLQIARLVAVIANGGELVQPHVLKRKGRASSNVRLRFDDKNIEVLKDAMKGVVEEENGTGSRAWSSVVSISGKTGTSQAGAGLDTHAWFAGFAPSDDPEVCFVIFLEHGGSGGDVSAMIAKKAVEYWYKNR